MNSATVCQSTTKENRSGPPWSTSRGFGASPITRAAYFLGFIGPRPLRKKCDLPHPSLVAVRGHDRSTPARRSGELGRQVPAPASAESVYRARGGAPRPRSIYRLGDLFYRCDISRSGYRAVTQPPPRAPPLDETTAGESIATKNARLGVVSLMGTRVRLD